MRRTGLDARRCCCISGRVDGAGEEGRIGIGTMMMRSRVMGSFCSIGVYLFEDGRVGVDG